MPEPPFRVLALDGGGIKGTFSAAVLAALEADTGQRAVDNFDLITGTSTGGIIAIGLALGLPAQTILDFYQTRGPVVFPLTTRLGRPRTLAQWFRRPKHSQLTLRSELEGVFGDRRLGEAKTRLVIPTYDAIAGRIFLMKTAHHPRFSYDHEALAIDVALATSAAPTYFKAADFPDHDGARYVDGGVWANSPVLVGIAEAVAFLGQSLSQIDVLSIGCTSSPFNIADRSNAGLADWNIGLLQLLMEGQVESSQAYARLLLNGRVHRIDAVVPSGQFRLDDARPSRIKELSALGRGQAVRERNLNAVKQRFMTGVHITPFLAHHAVDSAQRASGST